jgi:hypothetical protein
MNGRSRTIKGSAITEFGPAMLTLLVVFFFPLINILGLAASYAGGFFVNYTVANQVARVKQSEGSATASEVDGNFLDSGIGKFLGLTANSLNHSFTYIDAQKAQAAANGAPAVTAVPAQLQVTTTLAVKPFVNVPFLGFKPVTFNYYTEVPREETE